MRCRFSEVAGLIVAASMLSPFALAHADTLRMGGTGGDLATMRLLADAYARQHPKTTVQIFESMGSGGAVKAVLAGALDIGLTSRAPSKDERERGLKAMLYARSPLVFAVHKDSPRTGVTRQELVALYNGEPAGARGAVRLILRPEFDSDTLALRRGLPELEQPLLRAYQRTGVPVAATDQDAADMIAGAPDGFCTSTLSLIIAERRPLKPLALDGVAPSTATVASGRYPLVKEFYFTSV
jgi:phosphate transport system substrate-binding protein